MRKTRIGIVVPELGIDSEIWILRQCHEFTRIQPVLLCWKMRPTPHAEGLEIRLFKQPFGRLTFLRRVLRRLGLSAGAMPDAVTRRDIGQTVDDAKVEALLCHFAWTGLAVSNSLPSASPVVWQVHGRDVSASLQNSAYRRAVVRTLRRVRHIVAVGRFQIKRLKTLGLGDNFSVIPCGAPLGLFGQDSAPLRRPGQPMRFICVSRMSEEKGVLQSLSAFERAAAGRADMDLVFVGDGPLLPKLRLAAAASPHSARIRLTGSLPSDEVKRELAAAHAFLQHSQEVNGWIEGFGVSLTEAGAIGLPIIASRTGGIVDQVEHGENGLLFSPGDVETQSIYMTRLCDDEDLRRRLGDRARVLARRFDSKVMTAALEDVLLKAAGDTTSWSLSGSD